LPKSLPGHDIDLFDDYCEHKPSGSAAPTATPSLT
jgi:hypothetical protein